MSQKQNHLSTADRLSNIESRLAGLENAVMSAIRDLGMGVSQLVALRQAESATHDHHSHQPAEVQTPNLTFQFHTSLTDNTMYRVYQDAHDHPVSPSHIHIHTRRELGSNMFDALEVDHALEHLIIDEFRRQTGGAINSAFYLEVYRVTPQPIDNTSFVATPEALTSVTLPTESLPAVKQGIYEQLTPAQQMAQMVSGLTEQVKARQLGDASVGLPSRLAR